MHALDLERTIAEHERRGERICGLRGFTLPFDDPQDGEGADAHGVMTLAPDLPLIDAWAKIRVFVSSALFEYDVFQVDVEHARPLRRSWGRV